MSSGSLGFCFQKWVFDLREITFWNGMVLDSVALRPAVGGKEMSSKEPIEKRKMNSEIHVDGFLFDPMMPMVEARSDKQVFDEWKSPAQICVDEGRIEVNQEDVAVHGIVAETQDEHGDDGSG